MMYEQDFIMRLISEMIRTILKLVFNIDKRREEEIDFIEEDARETYNKLLDLIDAGKINEAENILLDEVDNNDIKQFEMALMFYSYLNDKDDIFIEQSDYTRDEIAEGIKVVAKRYGYDGLVASLLNFFRP